MIAAQFESLFKERAVADPFGVRLKAWEKAQKLGFPKKRHELYQYLPLRLFYETSFDSYSESEGLEECILRETASYPYRIVLINGKIASAFSSLEALAPYAVASDLNQASTQYRSLFSKRLSVALGESDAFALFNLALYDRGLFFYVPPQTIMEEPILILNILSGDAHAAPVHIARLHIHGGAHSSFACTFKTVSLSQASHFHNPYIDISLEENARLHWCQIHAAEPKKPLWDFAYVRAQLKRNAKLEALHFSRGSKTVRADMRVALLEEGASAELKGLWTLTDGHHAHIATHVEHCAPHCQSMQHFKGVLSGHSQSSFTGKIFVHPEAQKTQAYQLNNNLILNRSAVAQTKPGLEIFADDVKASHGATVAQMNPSDLFYLQTRGIDQQAAKKLLVRGFCQEITSLIRDEAQRNAVDAWIEAFDTQKEGYASS